jgi:hypothetical protein
MEPIYLGGLCDPLGGFGALVRSVFNSRRNTDIQSMHCCWIIHLKIEVKDRS